MTKVDLHFRLPRQLHQREIQRTAAAHSVYGIGRIRVTEARDEVIVEYDASRLTREQVEAILRRCGVPLPVPV